MEQKRPPVNYINNRDLYECLAAHVKAVKANPKNPPKVPEYIAESILLIANKLASKKNFCGYSYLDEMIADSFENCIRYLHNFDPEKTQNAFAYFTQIIFNAFIRRIKKEQKEQYVKLKNIEYLFSINEIEQIRSEPNTLYDNNHEFIARYEQRIKDKKKAVSEKQQAKGVEQLFQKDD